MGVVVVVDVGQQLGRACRTNFDVCYMTIHACGMQIEALGTEFKARARTNLYLYHMSEPSFGTIDIPPLPLEKDPPAHDSFPQLRGNIRKLTMPLPP